MSHCREKFPTDHPNSARIRPKTRPLAYRHWECVAQAQHVAQVPGKLTPWPTPRFSLSMIEALIRWSLTERLKSEGYDVLEADTGRAALDQLAEGVDLVLLDYRLPDSDGVTILGRSRSSIRTSS